MITSRFLVEVDWDKDGVYTDESELVRPVTSPVQVQYGRDQSTALSPTVSGTGSFTLDNRTRRFTPRNPDSPLYGYLKPARPVKIYRVVSGVASVDLNYYLFSGHTDDNPVNPDLDSRTVGVSLVDWLADFRGQQISTPLYSGIRTGEAINYILDACGWPSDRRDIDPGGTVIPWWWEEDTDALTALDKVVRSEGPPALLWSADDQYVKFRDRHHRVLYDTSRNSYQTWQDAGYGLVMAKGFTYDEAWRNIVNTGSASVDVRLPQETAAVWTSEATISLSAGEEKLITATASDPFYDAIAPVAGTDFVQMSGTTTASLFRTSGASATIKLASDSASVITGLQLRAKSVPVSYTVTVSASDSESIADYGPRAFPSDLPWCNQYDAEAVLQTTVAQRAQPLPSVQARFVIGTDPNKFGLMDTFPSERVTVQVSELEVNSDFHIESVSHTLTSLLDHEMTFGLEAAPQEPTGAAFTDDATVGADVGVAGAGLDNYNLLALLDTTLSGHRVDTGVTAA